MTGRASALTGSAPTRVSSRIRTPTLMRLQTTVLGVQSAPKTQAPAFLGWMSARGEIEPDYTRSSSNIRMALPRKILYATASSSPAHSFSMYASEYGQVVSVCG